MVGTGPFPPFPEPKYYSQVDSQEVMVTNTTTSSLKVEVGAADTKKNAKSCRSNLLRLAIIVPNQLNWHLDVLFLFCFKKFTDVILSLRFGFD